MSGMKDFLASKVPGRKLDRVTEVGEVLHVDTVGGDVEITGLLLETTKER